MKRIIAFMCVVLFAVSLVGCGSDPEANYNKALEYLEQGEYEKAHRIFYELGDYKDAEEYLGRFKVCFTKSTQKYRGNTVTVNCEYDGCGNLIMQDKPTSIGYDVIEDALKYEYTYLSSARILTRTDYELNDNGEYDLVSVTEYDYDRETQKLIKHRKYNAAGDLEEKYTYTENDEVSDNTTEACELTYDDHGNVIKRLVYSSDGSIQLEETYEYDKNGNLTKVSSTVGQDKDSTVTYVFSDFTYYYFTKTVCPNGLPEAEGARSYFYDTYESKVALNQNN